MQIQAAFDQTRPFGVEIETARNLRIGGDRIARALNDAGIYTENQRLNHQDRSYWKVVPDGTCGSEIVSPKLYGADGIEQIGTVCRVLQSLGLKVDSTTGLHVHHDASDVTGRQMKSLMNLSVKAQPFMDALLPSRIGSIWCRPISNDSAKRIGKRFDNLSKRFGNGSQTPRAFGEAFAQELGGTYHSRYSTINMAAAFLDHGTIEFRGHTGSLNPMKIAAWVIFTQGMLNAAMAKNITATPFKAAQSTIFQHVMYQLGSDANCPATKAARQNIAQRVAVTNGASSLGQGARYLRVARQDS